MRISLATLVIIIILGSIGVMLFNPGALTRPVETTDYLIREGYEDIAITGYEPWACSEDDDYHTGFTATKNGIPIKGVICYGPWKGSTLRVFD